MARSTEKVISILSNERPRKMKEEIKDEDVIILGSQPMQKHLKENYPPSKWDSNFWEVR
jgi:hypothetical protein